MAPAASISFEYIHVIPFQKGCSFSDRFTIDFLITEELKADARRPKQLRKGVNKLNAVTA